MHSVGLAFAREIWGRHRLLLALSVGYLLVMVLLVHALPTGTFSMHVVAEMSIPLWAAVLLLPTVFSHGDEADIVARGSGYPSRLFTLPLRTTALVGWPLALGAATVALFWLALSGLVLRAVDLPVPTFWVAVFLIALLAWMQALVWFPFPLPFLRIIVATVILGTMTTGATLGYFYEVSPALLLGASAGLIPLGYLVAVAGVARARRGDALVWNWPRLQRNSSVAPPHASAANALLWMEWVRHGFTLPFMTGLLVLPQLSFLVFLTPTEPAPFLGMMLMPLLMATAAGTSLGNCHPDSRRSILIPAFVAARPVTSGELLTAKYRVAVRSTLLAWAIVVGALGLAWPFCLESESLVRTRGWIVAQGVKGWVLVLLLIVGLPALTFKGVLNQLWVGLTGRRWIVITMNLSIPVGFTLLALFVGWLLTNPERHDAFRAVVPWAVGLALFLKVGGGLLVARILLRRGLATPRAVRRFAIAWSAGAAMLMGLAYWLMPPEIGSPPMAGCVAILFGLPLVRLGLAPLALDWNRHR